MAITQAQRAPTAEDVYAFLEGQAKLVDNSAAGIDYEPVQRRFRQEAKLIRDLITEARAVLAAMVENND